LRPARYQSGLAFAFLVVMRDRNANLGRIIIVAAVGALILGIPPILPAEEWRSCASALRQLESAAATAAAAALTAAEREEAMERARQELAACRGRCRAELARFEKARERYLAAVDRLEERIPPIDEAVGSANQACSRQIVVPEAVLVTPDPEQ
jgi:Sec-independent protein translocase protein TatA